MIPGPLRGGPPESRILAGYYVFNTYISFTFQAIKNLYAHFTYLWFGLFCKFFGDFLVYLEINSFSQRLVKFMEIGNFEDLVLCCFNIRV